MNDIAAIPVWFHGYHFRSRLEARWAVFFNCIGIKFDYEPQGFTLSDGTRYLPDFYLPHIRMFAEVKPVSFTREERRKCGLLSRVAGCGSLLLAGPPDFIPYDGVFWAGDDEFPVECDFSLDIGTYDLYYALENRLFSCPGDNMCAEPAVSELYRQAVYSSRAARFDSTDFPNAGHEPFNAGPREIEEGWR